MKVFGFILSVLLLVSCFYEPGYKRETKTLLVSLQKSTTPEEVRSWLLSVAKPENLDAGRVPKEEWPRWIGSIQTGHAFIGVPIRVQNGSTNVSFVWGDGRGFGGFFVDLSTNRPGPSEDRFFMEWVPGIYAWHSTK
jgi:hypothetical protein